MTAGPAAGLSALSEEQVLHWLALYLVQGLGPRHAKRLLDRYQTPEAVLRASAGDLESDGLAGTVARSLASGCSFEEAVLQHRRMREAGATLIPIADGRYPSLLRTIFDPPIVLFARGRLELFEAASVALVGTRRATPYGLAVAGRLAGELARAGLVIVSGMARGVDTAAHKGAIEAQGRTVAVLGCGVDVVYPSENRKLAAEIVEQGLLVSEFPMGSAAFPQNFPIRNRIISGLSTGVIVVEGAEFSGSAITAKLAMEQGREVFAVPGNVTSKMSWGPNLLIKQGAHLVQDWEDVVSELPVETRRLLSGAGSEKGEPERQLQLPIGPAAKMAAWALGQLRVEAVTHIDQLLDKLEEGTPSELIAALFELEMLGLVRQLPGKNFVKVW